MNTPTEIEARNAIRVLLQYMGQDPEREGLADTPRRVVAAWDELTRGYGQDPEQILGTEFGGEGYDQMIVCRGIDFWSMCEHHLLPFHGVAAVGYIPSNRVVGLSKMPRLVECFARRLQIQERLTQQVAEAMESVLKPKGVGVLIRARHLCMACRGVKQQEADMVTSALHGEFRRQEVRAEFFNLIAG